MIRLIKHTISIYTLSEYKFIETSSMSKPFSGEKCDEIVKGHFWRIAKTAHRASSREAAYSK